MDDAIKDSVGESGLTDDVMPLVDRKLAGHKGRSILVSFLDDFHETAALVGIEFFRLPIVEDQ
ncbi:hypothetical protein JCM17960_07150 [Magnetospira thiophila]